MGALGASGNGSGKVPSQLDFFGLNFGLSETNQAEVSHGWHPLDFQ